LGFGHLGEGEVNLFVAQDFELPLGTKARINLNQPFAYGGLPPGFLAP